MYRLLKDSIDNSTKNKSDFIISQRSNKHLFGKIVLLRLKEKGN